MLKIDKKKGDGFMISVRAPDMREKKRKEAF